MPLSHNFDLLASRCLLLTSLHSIRNSDQHAQREHSETVQQNCNIKYFACHTALHTVDSSGNDKKTFNKWFIFSMLVPSVSQVPTLFISKWCLLFGILSMSMFCYIYYQTTLYSKFNYEHQGFLFVTFYLLLSVSCEYRTFFLSFDQSGIWKPQPVWLNCCTV